MLTVNQAAAVDAIIVASILLMFGGMGVLGITSLRGKQLTGGRAWAPLLTVAAGLVAASFYSTNGVRLRSLRSRMAWCENVFLDSATSCIPAPSPPNFAQVLPDARLHIYNRPSVLWHERLDLRERVSTFLNG